MADMPKLPTIKGLYHYSFPCRDGEETRQFYEDILGLPLVACMMSDTVPSTGEHRPYSHFFFEMGDGSYFAFFDLGENEMPKPSPNTPDWVMHFAVEVDTVEQVLVYKERLNKAGIRTTDIVDHGFINSIYFFDPNGLRLEITARVDEPGEMEEMARQAHSELKRWTEKKAKLNAARAAENA